MKKEIILSQELTEKLLKVPETGMGYQVTDLILNNGEILYNVVVLNGKIAVVTKDVNSYEIIDVIVKDP